MRVLVAVFGFFGGLSLAQADISISCARDGKAEVRLHDVRGGYLLSDSGRYLGDQTQVLKPTIDSVGTIAFTVDVGTSVKRVYSFENLYDCYDEGTATNVELVISNRLPTGQTQQSEMLESCECHSD